MKTKIFLLILLCQLFLNAYATNSLRIIDPQCLWCNSYNASIKKAELEITPRGGFIENKLYLTVGLANPFTDPNLQLEIVLDFMLPGNSLIIDSWLWIDNVPKQSEILDRWTASTIYEQIVNRRKDPSLLVKNGSNSYTINIYPLKPNETRKFMITYLTPMKISGNKVLCDYPSGILTSSSTNVSMLYVFAYPNETFDHPAVEKNSASFSPIQRDDSRVCYTTHIPYAYFGKAKLSFTDTKPNPVKLFRYHSDNDGIYQISFVPSQCLSQETTSQKICFLIDFNKSSFTGTKAGLTSILSENLTGLCTEKDSFNVIFSNLSLVQAFDNWKPVTPVNLAEAFQNTVLSDYSNLIQLLVKGINFINNSGGNGKIVLLSNSTDRKGIEESNEILNDINILNSNNIPIDVIDYNQYWTYYEWIGNTYYFNNSYLLSNIARTNKGEYISFYENTSGMTISDLLTSVLEDVTSETIDNMDVYTDVSDGFCYGRMNFSSGSFTRYKMNNAVHQIGKYNGSFPITIEISGELNSRLIHNEFVLDEQEITETDSVLNTIWAGLNIANLESEVQNSQIINDIIYQSIENHVLSMYTAFLCLEDTIPLCEDCGDELPEMTHSDQIVLDEQIEAFPNPFSYQIRILLKTTDKFLSLEIYNLMGQLVKEFPNNDGQEEFYWDGICDNGSEAKPGIYLLVARYDDKVVRVKIRKI